MVYPRAVRPRPAPRTVDVAQHLVAFDPAASVDVRVAALWQLEGAPAFRAVAGGATLAERIGALLNEADLVVASEAYEALWTLDVAGGEAAREVAVVVDRRGTLSVSGKPIGAGGGAHEAGARFVPLVKIGALAPSTQAPVLQWPKVTNGNDLLVERGAHAKMPPGTLRVRGDEGLVGSLKDAALKLPIPRRQLRFRRVEDTWTVADVYTEGLVSIGGQALSKHVDVAHGTRIDVAGEGLLGPVSLTTKLVPRLDRKTGVSVRFRDQGRRVERLAAGEALYFGPGVDDDVPAPIRAHLVAGADGNATLVSAAPLADANGYAVLGAHGLKFEGDDVILRDVGG